MDDNNESANTKQKDPCGDSITMAKFETINDPATTANETVTDLTHGTVTVVNKMDSDKMYETITTDETETDSVYETPTDNKIHTDTVCETTTATKMDGDPAYGAVNYVYKYHNKMVDPVYIAAATSAYLHNY